MITRVGLYHEPQRNKPWLVRWWGDPDPDTGQQKKRSKSFRYQREAREFQAARQAAIDRGERPETAKALTLAQLVEEFAKARIANLSRKSQECYQNPVDQLLDYFGGSRLIRQIERRHAEAFIATRTRRDGRPGPLSSSTLSQHVTYAKAIFGAAVDWGCLARNPFAVPSRGSSPLRMKARTRPWQQIKPDELLRLLAVVPDVRRRAAYWLMYGCGLRPGEVYNLTADKVDLKRRMVHVENREPTEDIPPFRIKAEDRSDGSKRRSIPIPTAAITDLSEAVRLSFKSGGFVLLTPERFEYVREEWAKCRVGLPWGATGRTRPWENRDMVNNFLKYTLRALRRADIKLTAPFKLHTFRKSFAQNLADAGTPPKTLATLLGHSDVQVTMQYYARMTDANVREAARAADQLFASLQADRKAKGAG